MKEDELLALCADRALLTPELHASNDYYGHAAILKRYCGLPEQSALKVAVEHGVMLNDTIWTYDLNTAMPLFLCAEASHARQYESRTSGRRALPIGPMIHYANALSAPERRSARRVLTAFPAHSSQRVRVRYDRQALLRRLEGLRREFDEIVVCLYWRDVLHGAVADYAQRGFTCVSAGHIYDKEFLPRLVEVLRGSTLVYTNEVGSHVLYAALLDRPVWIERCEVRYEADAEIASMDVPAFTDHPNVADLLLLFGRRVEALTAEQLSFVRQLCGADYVRSPGQLREVLTAAAAEYRQIASLRQRTKDVLRRLRYHQRRIMRSRHH